MAILVGLCAPVNSMLSMVQSAVYSRKIRNTRITDPPIFIIGHWRSGTTFLHEILTQDQQFGFSSTFDCFVPHHFLVSRRIFGPLMRLLLPSHRPMDNMAAGIDLPQEDEFALFGSDIPTPYWRIAFCNDLDRYIDLLSFNQCDEQVIQRVQNGLTSFYQALTHRDGKPLILKSPTHTGRIETLARWFPGAKFIHISRHPYQFIPSTERLWKALDRTQSFQLPKYSPHDLQSYIFKCHQVMYEGYFAARKVLPDHQLMEISYEELVADPLSMIESIYRQLNLEAFEESRERFSELISERNDYQSARQIIDIELRQQIDTKCAEYMERFGYQAGESPAG